MKTLEKLCNTLIQKINTLGVNETLNPLQQTRLDKAIAFEKLAGI